MPASRTRFALSVAGLVALAAVGGCRPQLPVNSPKAGEGAGDPAGPYTYTPDNPDANVGSPLYKPADAPKFANPPAAGTAPIVIPNCSVMFEERQTVSAETDGTIELIATPMKARADGVYEYRRRDGDKETVVEHNPRSFDLKKLHPRIAFNPREVAAYPSNPEKWVPYYKLRDGEWVATDQLLCMLDDSLILTRRDAAREKRDAAIRGLSAAEEGVKLTRDKIALYQGKETAIAAVERINDQVTLARFVENQAQSAQAIAQAEGDYREAGVMLTKHRIKSRVSGFIRSVAKRDGEYVRAGEKIFEIQSTETVRLEGTVDVHYKQWVRDGMMVTVEPAIPSAPVRSHMSHSPNHTVAGVAVTGHSPRPMVVSVGSDGKAFVWDPNLDDSKDALAFPHALPHPAGVPVRSVACTPPGGKVLAVTGADDGRVRVWDLTDLKNLPSKPSAEPTDYHASAVTAVAVSPDGRHAATAAGREVFVWDLASAKKLYSLPPEHRDGVTSLAFTPQAQLVTASRDRTLKVWKLGAEKAAVARTIEHRSGVVDTLAVSPDGGRVLFDQAKDRIDLLDLTNGPTAGQPVGQLSNVGPGVSFATLALFFPSHAAPGTPAEQLPPYRMVTAGGEGDLRGGLQVWEVARAGGRGAEIARLVTHGRAAVSCAAFSPVKEAPFLVVGTEGGSVQVWTPPTGPAKKHQGRITYTEVTGPRYATVRVEMNNRDLGLLDRSSATVVVNPGQQQ